VAAAAAEDSPEEAPAAAAAAEDSAPAAVTSPPAGPESIMLNLTDEATVPDTVVRVFLAATAETASRIAMARSPGVVASARGQDLLQQMQAAKSYFDSGNGSVSGSGSDTDTDDIEDDVIDPKDRQEACKRVGARYAIKFFLHQEATDNLEHTVELAHWLRDHIFVSCDPGGKPICVCVCLCLCVCCVYS
jgi:hypothetical protein